MTPCLRHVATALALLALGTPAAADGPLAGVLTADELGRVKKGETVVRRSASNGRVETVVAGRINAPPSWVYAQMADACHLKHATDYSGEPVYVTQAHAEAAIAAAKPGSVTRNDVENLATVPCGKALLSSPSYSYTPWHLPWPLPDGWSFSRGERTSGGASGGTIRSSQVAGTMRHMEYRTDITPLDENTLFVAVSVFVLPFPVPDFMLKSSDQSSRHIITIRERAKSAPWNVPPELSNQGGSVP